MCIAWLSMKWNLWTENREFSMWDGCCNCYCRHLSGTRCLYSCILVCVIHSFIILHAVEMLLCYLFRWKLRRQQCINEILLNGVERKLISAYDCSQRRSFCFLHVFFSVYSYSFLFSEHCLVNLINYERKA